MHPGLYLHVPFCSKICPYCDFSVLTGGQEARERFVGRLVEEIRRWGEDEEALAPFAGADTVYFGGGTPSALAPEQLERVLAAAREHLPVRDDAAVSFEANPEDVTPEAARAWRGLGVRFLSLGVQSLDPEALRFLGRRHTPEEARGGGEGAHAGGV
jgi:oxygen-independent coproporphyrinogen III oxidase